MKEEIKKYLMILGIEEIKNLEDLKSKVRKLIIKYHPDLNPENKVEAEEKLKKILFAYEKLRSELEKNPELIFRKKEEEKINIYSTKFLTFILEEQEFAIPVEYVTGVSRLKDLDYQIFNNTIIANFRNKYIFLNYSEKFSSSELGEKYVVILEGKSGILVDKVEKVITTQIPVYLDKKTKFVRYEDRYIPLFEFFYF
jgi:hypothetical protein